ncbi:DUF2269 family protein [Yinghuangia soli]|uniref:DUF2269 family protein n=1 Tax=Yinghuangia soli TaxID=2908204 RepID=A0AA41Q5E0_9ACTN|nr:DUF2269 family protein [Yinghuangia soli]MCF2531895.1 DUF2269 family protein [Yinghuangia soli]
MVAESPAPSSSTTPGSASRTAKAAKDAKGTQDSRMKGPAKKGRQFSRGVRRAVNSGHVVASVGLVGVEIVMIMLGVIAKNTGDATLQHATYQLMRMLAYAAGIPLAVLAMVSGVVLALRTPWGLWKHQWIKVKFVLLIVVIAIGAGLVSQWVRDLADKTEVGADQAGLAAVQWYQLAGAGVQLTALVVATFLSVYKPSGSGRVAKSRGSGRGSASVG